jgi:hypothetical protein
MKKLSNEFLDKMVSKILNETLEEKANDLVSKINKKKDLEDGEIHSLMSKSVSLKEDDDVCEQCGSGEMGEGVCNECGYKNESIYHRTEDELPPVMDEDIYDVSDDFSDEQEFDYVEENDGEIDDETEEDMENEEFCKYQLKHFGPEDERFKEKCKTMSESLKGGQKKLDKNKNNKIDAEDFKLLRKSKKKETDEEVEEGNAFTGSLSKAKEEGKSSFDVDGKKYQVKEGKKQVSESIQLTENELIGLIEKIVKEQTSGMKTLGKPKGLAKYEQVHKADGKENDEYLKSVAKKMKEYLKDGSKGDYETNPKHFPKGNGELGEMKKKAYKASDAVKDYVDNFTAAGLENIVYDEIEPNEDWVEDNVVGSSRTGNNPEWANTAETDVNKKRNEIRKKNLLGQIKKKAYNKAVQPISKDKAGETEGDKIMAKLESVESKTEKKLNEEFEKMKKLISYDKKTQ